MKRFSLFLITLLFIAGGCKKEPTLVDEIDAFVGAYDYEFSTVGQDDDGPYTFSGAGVMGVSNFGSLVILLTDDDGTIYRAIYDGEGAFHLEEDIIDYGGGEVFRLTGEGFFGNRKMQLVITAEALSYFDKSIITMIGDKQ